MPSLYQISEDTETIAELLAELEQDENLSPEDIDEKTRQILGEWLGENETQFKDKVDSYVWVMREFEGTQQAAKKEAKRLQDRAKVFGNRVERLKNTLRQVMDRLQLERVETDINTVSIAKNGGTDPMDINIELLPERYVITTPSPNRKLILAAIASGESVDGVTVLERGTHLKIK